MLMEKVDNLSDSSVHTTTILSNIEEHLRQLNSKVATHEKQLHEHSSFISRATGIATLLATTATIALNKIL